MVLQTWSQVLGESFQNLWLGVISFLPTLLAAIVVFVVGWIVAAIVEKLVAQFFRVIMVDKVLRSAGVEDVVARAGMRLDSGMFFGGLAKWFIIVVFLVASLELVGLEQVTQFLKDVVLKYLPQVIVAALILLVAAVVANAAGRVVSSSARAAEIQSAAFLGGISRWAIWVFAIIIALSHLGIAPDFMQVLFTGLVAMLALAGGLAFGLGGKEAAARYIERLRDEISRR